MDQTNFERITFKENFQLQLHTQQDMLQNVKHILLLNNNLDIIIQRYFKICNSRLSKYICNIYRVRHIFWPGVKWQFCQSVHIIFKKIFLEDNVLGVVNVNFEWFFKYTSSSFKSYKNERVIYRKKYHSSDSQWMTMG